MGQIIRPRCLKIASHISSAIRDLRPPTTVTELKPFLELRSFPSMCPQFLSTFGASKQKAPKSSTSEVWSIGSKRYCKNEFRTGPLNFATDIRSTARWLYLYAGYWRVQSASCLCTSTRARRRDRSTDLLLVSLSLSMTHRVPMI